MTQGTANRVFDLQELDPTQAKPSVMKFKYFSILILSFQVIFFANARNNQSQNGANGKEIDTASATSLDNRMDIFGRGFEDLHRRIARSPSMQDSLNYQVKLVKFVSVVEFRNIIKCLYNNVGYDTLYISGFGCPGC